MSWQSTQSYYQLINEGVQARLGGLHSAPLLINSFDFAEIEALQMAGQWADAGRLLARQAAALQAAGAEAIFWPQIPCISWLIISFLQVTVPFLHIADATAEAILASPSRQPLLLATGLYNGTGFLHRPFGCKTSHPQAGRFIYRKHSTVKIVHQVIYEELCKGVIDSDSRTAYQQIIQDEAETKGCDGVILGCTEIGLLISQKDTDLPVFDTTALHCAQITDFICAHDRSAQ